MKEIIQYFCKKINTARPFTFIDVGAMEGIPRKWDDLASFIKVVAFEPDEREFSKLIGLNNFTYFNYALFNSSEDLNFYVAQEAGKSSLYKPNQQVLSQFEGTNRFQTLSEKKVLREHVKTLDMITQEKFVTDVDFIKLDTQGSELAILEGGLKTLPQVFGIQIEVEFIEMYKNQPLFRDVDAFLSKAGFQLMDLRRFYWKQKDYYDFVGKGQLIFADALYFKKKDIFADHLASREDPSYGYSKMVKAILTCLVYKAFDYAVSVARMGLERRYLSKKDYDEFKDMIIRASQEGVWPDFPGKNIFYKILNKICDKLKPKSYLGWADSDCFISNIKDI